MRFASPLLAIGIVQIEVFVSFVGFGCMLYFAMLHYTAKSYLVAYVVVLSSFLQCRVVFLVSDYYFSQEGEERVSSPMLCVPRVRLIVGFVELMLALGMIVFCNRELLLVLSLIIAFKSASYMYSMLYHTRPIKANVKHKVVYNDEEDGNSSCKHAGQSMCCICLIEFSRGDLLTALECGHAFHPGCIDRWLSNQPLCPLRCKPSLASSMAL
jgi:hypothetical protein